MTSSDFPNDDNGDALRNMALSGDDLSKARDIHFSVSFADIVSSDKFVKYVNQEGLQAKQEPDGATDSTWDVTVTSHMIPSHDAITLMENRLDKLAAPFGGWNDGWGCFAVEG